MGAEFPYSKIPGSRRGILLGGSLWLGADHLLSVKNLRFTEEYRRYSYRDIQAIVIRKTPRFYVHTGYVWGLFAWVACEIAALAKQRPPVAQALLVIPGIAILWLLYAGWLRSCRCHIQTAVSRDEIPALVRLRDARRAVDLIAGRITEAQGAMPEEWTVDDSQTAPVRVRAAGEDEPVPASINTGMWWALATFLLLLVDVGFTYFHSQNRLNHAAQIGASVLMLAEAAIMIVSLTILRAAKVVRTLRNLIIASLVFAGLTYYLSYMVSSMLEQFRRGGTPQPAAMASIAYWIDVVNETGNLALGVAGLAVWATARKKILWQS